MGSGYASYDVDLNEGGNYELPVVIATEESLRGLATVVYDFDAEEVLQVQWPYTGTRSLDPDTGFGGVVSGLFSFNWVDGKLKATNESVGGRYTVCTSDDKWIYTQEANYHPDGGQVVCPVEPDLLIPFYVVLAPPGDDVTPENFIAFYCDGTFGIQILPNVWHQPVIPASIGDSIHFNNKQGSIHGCVEVNTLKEFGKWLVIPKMRGV